MEISSSKKKLLYYATVSNLISVGFQSYLSLQHYKLKFGLVAEKSACNINATFNCDAVSVSRFASIFNIPMAVLAVSTHLILIAFLLSSALEMSSNPKRILRYSLWISLFVAFMSILMGGISTALLGTFCLYCMICYFLSFVALFLIWKAQEDKLGFECGLDLKALLHTERWAGVLIAIIPVIGFVGHKSLESSFLGNLGGSRLEDLLNSNISDWKSAASFDFNIENSLTYQAGSGTPVMTIVEFADFLCPHCKLAGPSLHLFASTKNDVRLIFKSFPLDGSCNKDVTHKGDGVRCSLAYLMFCSEKLYKKGWAANEYFFEHQDTVHNLSLEDGAKTIAEITGGNEKELADCARQDSTFEAISAQAKEGANAKLEGTPTIYVNGKKLERGQFLPLLERVYSEIKGQ